MNGTPRTSRGSSSATAAVRGDRSARQRLRSAPGGFGWGGVVTAARASAGYDTHQRVVVRSRVTERQRMYRTQRQARCEAWYEEREGARDAK